MPAECHRGGAGVQTIGRGGRRPMVALVPGRGVLSRRPGRRCARAGYGWFGDFRPSGCTSRQCRAPAGMSLSAADCAQGILTVTVPLREPAEAAKKIEVASGE